MKWFQAQKTDGNTWRLPRAGICGVPEADVFFAAFDNMCEVLEQSADEIPANYRAQIETACADFVAMNEKMGISPFCILDFESHIEPIADHELREVTEKEKNELRGKGLLDYRQLFEQMVSVYADKEVVDEIARFQESKALLLLDEAEARPKSAPGMSPAIGSDDAEGWQRAAERLLACLTDAISRTKLSSQLAAAAAHLKETISGTMFSAFGVYTRKCLADVLSKRDGITVTEAEARIRRREEAGQIRRVDYWGILNSWDDSEFYYRMWEMECRAVCDAVCRTRRSAARIGLVGDSRTEPGDGLEM